MELITYGRRSSFQNLSKDSLSDKKEAFENGIKDMGRKIFISKSFNRFFQ